MNIFLRKFGTILISRPAGKEAFLVLQPLLKGLPKSEQLKVDFKDVSVLTPSWADEFITPLLNKYKKRVALVNTKNPSVQATLATLKKAEQERKK